MTGSPASTCRCASSSNARTRSGVITVPIAESDFFASVAGPSPVRTVSGSGSILPDQSCQLGFNQEKTESARQQIIQGVIKIIPDLAQAQLVLQTACLRPVTPDWLPIVGKATGWDNVYLTTGAGKKGILLSPGMGKATADLISQGSTILSIGPCAPDRFSSVSSPQTVGDGDNY